MAVKLFGFSFGKEDEPQWKKDEPVSNTSISFIDRDSESTAAVISSSFTSGMFVDMQGAIRAEADLVTKYRDMCLQAEVDNAVDEICNETITTEDDFIVKIDLSKVTILNEQSKRIIEEMHQEILTMLDFNAKAYWIFRRWYVDGRIYYHAVVDEKHLEEGIKELRYIDPRKIREIKEVTPKNIMGGATGASNEASGIFATNQTKFDYYLYNDRGFASKAPYMVGYNGMATQGIRIAKDSVVHVPSGLTDSNNTLGLGYLNKAIKVLSQLKTIEDSLIIYRLARAPERRVWYIDVGNMPKIKADQYVRDVMINQKNKLIYDADTGAMQDSRKFMTMTEDYWLPKRSDGQGSRVEPLPGGQTLGQIEDIVYFQKLLYNSLNVPIQRLQPDSPFDIGNTEEITKAEVKFYKFINRLKLQFSLLFRDTLKKHVILRGLMSLQEFEMIEKYIDYVFAVDNHWKELKDAQIMGARINTFNGLAQTGLIGTYFSHAFVRRNIFQQTQDDIDQMTMEIIEESQNPLYNRPTPEQQEAEVQTDRDQASAEQEVKSQQEQQMSQEDAENSVKSEKEFKLQKAKMVIDAIKQIKTEQRTPGDKNKLRSAALIAAKA